jgi:hypothetical protein
VSERGALNPAYLVKYHLWFIWQYQTETEVDILKMRTTGRLRFEHFWCGRHFTYFNMRDYSAAFMLQGEESV